MDKEQLKWVEGYEDIYIITSAGRLFSLTRRDALFRIQDGGELKVHLNGAGYKFVALYKNGKKEEKTIHRLVAENFIPNNENKPCVDHINGNKLDNRVENLRWVTYKENMNNPVTHAHAMEIIHKTVHLGNSNPFSRRVGQYNANDDLIAEFESTGDAERKTGIKQGAIQKCAKGIHLSAGGYVWKYLSEAKCKMPKGKFNAFGKQKIAQYKKDGTFIAEYDSIASAASNVGGDAANISRAARGVIQSSKGFIWKYVKS